MDTGRTQKVSVNLCYTLITQVLTLVLNFVIRTVFIRQLGAGYLGINGLFTNILTILSLSELGFGNAIIYSLYRPLAERDTQKISEIMSFYRRIYRVIFAILTVMGLAFIPFLHLIISVDNIPISEVILYYVLFLANTLASYCFAYHSNLIIADQKVYVIKQCNLIRSLVQFALQLFFLVVLKSYILFLVTLVGCTFFNNILFVLKSHKFYPDLRLDQKLCREEQKEIFSNVKSIFVYKVATTLVENIDNILISSMIGTVVVGLYSNYFLLFSTVFNVIAMFFGSFTASIGNLNVGTDTQKKEEVFTDIIFINSWIMVVSSVCFFFCISPFIEMWIGTEYLLEFKVVAALVMNYYLWGILNPVCVYRDTTGIFKAASNISVVLALTNLVLSVAMGKKFGLFGIVAATGISKILTNVWYQPYILYKDVFKSSPWKYFREQFKNVSVIVLSIIVLGFVVPHIVKPSLFPLFMVAILCFLFSCAVFLLFNLNNKSIGRLKVRFFDLLKSSREK